MQMIHIHASSHDQNELVKRVAPFRQPGFVRRQIAGDDVRRTWHKRTEIPAAAQVRRWSNLLRLPEEWVPAREELVVPRAGVVASIAVARPVDQVAAYTHQAPVLSSPLPRSRPNPDTLLIPPSVSLPS